MYAGKTYRKIMLHAFDRLCRSIHYAHYPPAQAEQHDNEHGGYDGEHRHRVADYDTRLH